MEVDFEALGIFAGAVMVTNCTDMIIYKINMLTMECVLL
jgi:hypothetical protein